ncbi:cell division membrane protein [Lacticaseibacillus paracasei subsp. paracasei ATCC 25302 = DSM 5622 = JCM 8130]|nr:cell division membrane protein [Lacticaseibacillus paracasei subsp. paracasei ATCC 25302 = DSM 5622 = JCM 8130]
MGSWAIYLYIIMVFIYILISWFPNAQGSALDRFLSRFVDPFLSIFQRFIPPLAGIDFSPILAFFVLSLIKMAWTKLFIMLVQKLVIG